MSNTIQFTCCCCGQLQNEWPALTFKAPYHYAGMSEADKASRGELDTDFCVIRHYDQVDRFIRVTLTQKVIGGCQHLNYGVWVSLSEASFQDYADRFGDETQNGGVQYFGWLCNDIPGYQFDESIPMAVWTKAGNDRPEIVPKEDMDHPFVHDYYHGITEAEAIQRIQAMLAQVPVEQLAATQKKPWWKVW